jgi:hypothetical protein
MSSYPVLTFEAEFQPYVSQQGNSSLPQANWTGKGYSLFRPAVVTRFSDAADDGTSMPLDARHAFVFVKAGGIRIRTDATNPSPTSGLYIPAGTLLTFKNQAQTLQQFRFVDNTGETSEVSCMWFA